MESALMPSIFDAEEKPEVLSIKELKARLKKTLSDSGVTENIQSKIRSEVIKGLKTSDMNRGQINMEKGIQFSQLFHELKKHNLTNTLSVFLPESGLTPKEIISEADVLHYSKNSRDSSCQTETVVPSVREALDKKIIELQTQHEKNKENILFASDNNKCVEEKMIQYQRDCDQRVQSEIKQRVDSFIQNESIRIRLEESSKHRHALELQRQELEQEYASRVHAHMEREATNARRMADQERDLQRSQYDARQLLQREIDELRAREANLSRKYELETQGLRLLEARLKESQGLIESREREVSRREKLCEERTKECHESARKEAYDHVRSEAEMNARDRAALILDRQRLHDERAAHASQIDSNTSLRVQLKTALDELVHREDELNGLKRNNERMAAHRAEEDRQISEMMQTALQAHDPSSLQSLTRPQQIVQLIQMNAQLEVKLAALRDPKGLQVKLNKAEEELTAAQDKLRDLQRQYESDIYLMKTEIDHMNRTLLEELSRVASLDSQLSDCKAQLDTKNKVIESLSKLESGLKTSGCGGTGSGGSASSRGQRGSRLPVRVADSHGRDNDPHDMYYAKSLLSKPEYSRNIPNSHALLYGFHSQHQSHNNYGYNSSSNGAYRGRDADNELIPPPPMEPFPTSLYHSTSLQNQYFGAPVAAQEQQQTQTGMSVQTKTQLEQAQSRVEQERNFTAKTQSQYSQQSQSEHYPVSSTVFDSLYDAADTRRLLREKAIKDSQSRAATENASTATAAVAARPSVSVVSELPPKPDVYAPRASAPDAISTPSSVTAALSTASVMEPKSYEVKPQPAAAVVPIATLRIEEPVSAHFKPAVTSSVNAAKSPTTKPHTHSSSSSSSGSSSSVSSSPLSPQHLRVQRLAAAHNHQHVHDHVSLSSFSPKKSPRKSDHLEDDSYDEDDHRHGGGYAKHQSQHTAMSSSAVPLAAVAVSKDSSYTASNALQSKQQQPQSQHKYQSKHAYSDNEEEDENDNSEDSLGDSRASHTSSSAHKTVSQAASKFGHTVSPAKDNRAHAQAETRVEDKYAAEERQLAAEYAEAERERIRVAAERAAQEARVVVDATAAREKQQQQQQQQQQRDEEELERQKQAAAVTAAAEREAQREAKVKLEQQELWEAQQREDEEERLYQLQLKEQREAKAAAALERERQRVEAARLQAEEDAKQEILERERIETERQQRMTAQQERLKREREEREAADRAEAEAVAERERLAEEKRQAELAAKREKEESERKAREEAERKEREAREETERVEREAREEKEREEKRQRDADAADIQAAQAAARERLRLKREAESARASTESLGSATGGGGGGLAFGSDHLRASVNSTNSDSGVNMSQFGSRYEHDDTVMRQSVSSFGNTGAGAVGGTGMSGNVRGSRTSQFSYGGGDEDDDDNDNIESDHDQDITEAVIEVSEVESFSEDSERSW